LECSQVSSAETNPRPRGGPLGSAEDAIADRRRNALLARLPVDEDQRLASQLEPVSLTPRDVVERQGEPLEAVYFPLDVVVSVVESTDTSGEVEITTIGNEGVVGMQAFLGAAASPFNAHCQVPGRALRLGSTELRASLNANATLHQLFRVSAQVTIAQLSRNVICHQLHQAEPRTARWLLMTHDRVGADEFQLTQDFLAQMLGVRRMTVSEVASGFQQRGLIRYTRGRITIIDRAGLEASACECYRILHDQTRTLLDQPPQPFSGGTP
jgi:CRP-like cAMP-binding protein